MQEPKRISPLLDGYSFLSCVSEADGTAVYRMRSDETGITYILTQSRIPASATQVEALILSGAAADEAAAKAYYEEVLVGREKELSLLQQLGPSTGVLACTGFQSEPLEDGVGFLLSTLTQEYQSLSAYMAETAMTHLSALNLGIDLGLALAMLARQDLLPLNVTLDNVFIGPQKHFLFGNLHVANRKELRFGSMPENLLGEFTAPEMFSLTASLNETIDLYALGLILYRIYNGNHAPFADERTSAKEANDLRLQKQPLPTPIYADYELSEIILKACAPEPEDRYQSAEDFCRDLSMYMKRNTITDELIVPPIITDLTEPITEEEMNEPVEPIQFAEASELDADFVSHLSPDQAAPVPAGSDESEATAPDTTAPEDAAPPAKKKLPRWLLISGIVVVLAAFAVALFFYLRPAPVEITGITLKDKGTDYISLSVAYPDDAPALEAVCADSYGNEQRQPLEGSDCTFTGLTPGVQYTVTVQAINGASVRGKRSAMISTDSVTEISAFTVSDVTSNSAQIDLTVQGPEPEEWILHYTSEEGQSASTVFTGHSHTLQNLSAGAAYTLTLEAAPGFTLDGQLEATCTTLNVVDLASFEVTSLSGSEATVSWTYTGTLSGDWTVVCRTANGTELTQTTSGLSATFTGLQEGTSYEFSLETIGLQPSALQPLLCTTADYSIQSLSATATAAGTVSVSWQSLGLPDDAQWLLTYAIAGSEVPSSAVTVTGDSATLENLIPNTTYEITLTSVTDAALEGASTTVTTPEATKFSDYGISNVFLGFFLKPEKETWTYRDLAVSRKEYRPSEGVAFAIEAIYGVSSSDKSVQTLYVVRNADGVPVDYYTGERSWDSMWTKALHVGSLDRTPQTPGVYTLEIYFNGQLVTSKQFTITAE